MRARQNALWRYDVYAHRSSRGVYILMRVLDEHLVRVPV